jgi:uncharacterized repeat protein (TIGR04138 family)
MAENLSKSVEEIVKADGRYAMAAVHFVRQGLGYTVKKHHPNAGSDQERCHVTGEMLCHGLREMARQRWGLMAAQVLASWNISSTRDFGEIIFLLVENGWMKKEPRDCIEDFDEVYDFSEAFSEGIFEEKQGQ